MGRKGKGSAMGDRDRDRDRCVLHRSRARWKNGSCDTADAHGPVCARPAVVLLIAAGDAGTGTCAAAPRACQRVRGTRVRQHLAGAGRRLGAHGETVVRSDTVHANGLARVRHWWSGGPSARQPHSCARLTVSAAPASVLQGPIVTDDRDWDRDRDRGKDAAGKDRRRSRRGTGSARSSPRHGRGAQCVRAGEAVVRRHMSPEHIPA